MPPVQSLPLLGRFCTEGSWPAFTRASASDQHLASFPAEPTSTASFDPRPCQPDASLGRLAATVLAELSSPGVPPFLARQESPATPSFANAAG